MSQRSHVDHALQEFCARNGVPAFALGADGVACLELADGRQVFIILDDEQGRLFACAELRKLPGDPSLRLALLETVMAMNFLQRGTGPATLALKNRGLFCQLELPADGLAVDDLEQGMALALEQAGAIGTALAAAVRQLSAALADS